MAVGEGEPSGAGEREGGGTAGGGGDGGGERLCRICYDGEDSAANPLFRPCRCRGSMRWVHMECLNHWRLESANPRSYFECDSCKFKYRFGNHGVDSFTLAWLLSTRGAVHGLAVLLLALLIFLAGFVGKWASGGSWREVLDCFNLNHLISGSIATGLGSLLGWLLTAAGGGFGGGWFFGGDVGGRVGGRDDKAGQLLVAIMVVVGLCLALTWIYDRLEDRARRTARMAQQVVLDAQGGEPHFEHVD